MLSLLKGRSKGKNSDAGVSAVPAVVPQNLQPLQLLEQGGNHSQSMKLLTENGLRPLTYQEALSRSSELIEKFKGKWFWLSGQGIHEEDEIYAFDGKGEFVKSNGKESVDQKVRVYPGNQPLSLGVNWYDGARYLGGRFGLFGDSSLDFVAPVVVGVRSADAIMAEGKVVLERLRRNLPK